MPNKRPDIFLSLAASIPATSLGTERVCSLLGYLFFAVKYCKWLCFGDLEIALKAKSIAVPCLVLDQNYNLRVSRYL